MGGRSDAQRHQLIAALEASGRKGLGNGPMATIGTSFLSEIRAGGRPRSDLIARGLDPAVPRLAQPFTQLARRVAWLESIERHSRQGRSSTEISHWNTCMHGLHGANPHGFSPNAAEN